MKKLSGHLEEPGLTHSSLVTNPAMPDSQPECRRISRIVLDDANHVACVSLSYSPTSDTISCGCSDGEIDVAHTLPPGLIS